MQKSNSVHDNLKILNKHFENNQNLAEENEEIDEILMKYVMSGIY